MAFQAQHRYVGGHVALKLMRSGEDATPEELERFRREAQNSARLRQRRLPHAAGVSWRSIMAGRKPSSDLVGRWHIVSMTAWDEDYLNEEVQAFIEFGPRQQGAFQFGYVQGEIDYRITQRDGKPAVEFSWDGNDEMDPAQGRGWAVLEGGELHGMIFFHCGDESGFVARPAKEKEGRKRE